MSVAVPEQGQIVEVRRRRYVVADVTKSTLAQSALATELTSIQHLVTLASIEDDAFGDELQVIWELEAWLQTTPVKRRAAQFLESHMRWRLARKITPPETHFPGLRYVLLHSFAHALMRQFVLECGYNAASLRERIYSRDPRADPNQPEPMAGVLIYTAAPDSEGTLGGLVSLGEEAQFRRHLVAALRAAEQCASDPLCAEHEPSNRGTTVHAAACHACLFAPETSCERGNKYLDRSVLMRTIEQSDLAFFTTLEG